MELLGQLDLHLQPGRIVRRKQPQREPGQFCRGVGGTAHTRVPGGRLELLHDSGVRPGRREREMPCPLLRVAHEVGGGAMRFAEPGGRSGRVDRRCEERVNELDPPVHFHANEPGLLRRSELDRIDRLGVGSRQGRGAQQRVARCRRKCADACPDECVEILWNRNAAREVVLALAVQLARDLDRVERIAARSLRDPHKRGSRERTPELLGEDAVQGGDR